jgi:hypothetical protein
MKTEQLISRLSAEAEQMPRAGHLVHKRLLLATLLTSAIVLSILLTLFSRSHHFAAYGPTVLFTSAAGATLAIIAFCLTTTMSRPDAQPRLFLLLVPLFILLSGLAIEMSRNPVATLRMRWINGDPLGCLISVSLLSLPVLAGSLIALRAGAPRHPALAGALAGLLASGVTIALYVLHCPSDSLLYVVTWHGLAALLVTALGALIGSKVLRW